MRHALFAAAFAFAATPVVAGPVAVTVEDKGVATLCAEEDNVYAAMSSSAVRRFQVVARQPIYGAVLKTDVHKPDFTHCAISAAKDFKFTPRTVTLYEDAKVMVKGVTYPSYWRPEQVPVEVAGRKDRGFHLLQLFLKMDGPKGGRLQEVMVMHVADGYWRLRPLPLPQFKGGVYGTSFLIGPIEETTRPFVRFSQVAIDPKTLTVHVTFVQGGEANVHLLHADRQEARLQVTLTPQAASGPMFAAIRSMYVAPGKADTARVVWTAPGAQPQAAPVVGFKPVQAVAVAFDRPIPSKHNTAAPDMVFEGFDDGRQPGAPSPGDTGRRPGW